MSDYWKSDNEVFAAGSVWGTLLKDFGDDKRSFYTDVLPDVDEDGNYLRSCTFRAKNGGTLFRVTVEEVGSPSSEAADLLDLQKDLTDDLLRLRKELA